MVVELCAGKGYLLEFLRRRGYRYLVGYDLEGCRYNSMVKCVDLNNYMPPIGSRIVWVFQHCIEHLDQDRVVEMIGYALNNDFARIKAIIGIVPGHLSNDPTHVVNHYHYEDLLNLIREIKPRYWYIRPDMMSYINPSATDYLVIMSNKPFNPKKTYPILLRYVLGLTRRIINKYI